MNSDRIKIDYFSDILCVWAWITQRRIDELNNYFKDKIEIHYRYIDIFGDTATRIQEQWADKGLYEGFRDHVVKSAVPYESAVVNDDVWYKTRPATSATPHMILKSIESVYSSQLAIEFAAILRKAFFVEARDIANLEVIYGLAKANDIDVTPIKNSVTEGTALAALMRDYQNAKTYDIKGSPCFVMNEGRQILFGNVGYRVLRTNIEELLNHDANEASWC